MGIGFAAAVAGGGDTHQAGVELVLDITLEHTVFDQGGALGADTLIVHAQGTAAPGQGAVIDDGAQAGRHALTDTTAVGGAALAVEVALQTMADRLVQQHARPAGAHDHRHATGRGGNRLQIDQRLTQRLAGIAHGAFFAALVAFEEVAVVGTPATTMTTTLTPAILLDDHADVEAHQRPDISAQATVHSGHQDTIPDAGQAHRYLLDPGIQGAGGHVDTLEQLDLLGPIQHIQGIVRRIQGRQQRAAEGLHPPTLPGPGDGAGRLGRLAQSIGADHIAVGEAGFLTGLGAHADALIEVEAAFLDDAVFQGPGFRDLALEIQIGGVDARAGEFAQHARQLLDTQAAGGQQVFADRQQHIAHNGLISFITVPRLATEARLRQKIVYVGPPACADGCLVAHRHCGWPAPHPPPRPAHPALGPRHR